MSCVPHSSTEKKLKTALQMCTRLKIRLTLCPLGQKKLDSSYFMGKRKLHKEWKNPDHDDEKTDFEHTNTVEDERHEASDTSDQQETDNIPFKQSRFNNEENRKTEKVDPFGLADSCSDIVYVKQGTNTVNDRLDMILSKLSNISIENDKCAMEKLDGISKKLTSIEERIKSGKEQNQTRKSTEVVESEDAIISLLAITINFRPWIYPLG